MAISNVFRVVSLSMVTYTNQSPRNIFRVMFFILQRRRVAIRLPRLTVMTSVIFCKLVKDFSLYGDSNPGQKQNIMKNIMKNIISRSQSQWIKTAPKNIQSKASEIRIPVLHDNLRNLIVHVSIAELDQRFIKPRPHRAESTSPPLSILTLLQRPVLAATKEGRSYSIPFIFPGPVVPLV